MRKNYGAKPFSYPQPVFIIAAYDENGLPNAMNAAWGGISEMKEISICISEGHKTTANILKRKAKKVGLTVSDFVRSSLIHSDNLTINVIDTSVLSKTLFELHKHGVNLNQLMKFCNTYGLDAFNESHVIPTLENERTVFLQTKAALLSLEEEARRGNVMVNLELSDDMEEEDS